MNGGEQLSGVEFVVAQGLLDGERTLFEEGQFDAGPLAAETEQGVAEQVAAEQCQTQPQRTAFDVAVAVDAGEQQVAFVQEVQRVAVHSSPMGWWRPGVLRPFSLTNNGTPSSFFQCLYGFADGGWVRLSGGCGGRKLCRRTSSAKTVQALKSIIPLCMILVQIIHIMRKPRPYNQAFLF